MLCRGIYTPDPSNSPIGHDEHLSANHRRHFQDRPFHLTHTHTHTHTHTQSSVVLLIGRERCVAVGHVSVVVDGLPIGGGGVRGRRAHLFGLQVFVHHHLIGRVGGQHCQQVLCNKTKILKRASDLFGPSQKCAQGLCVEMSKLDLYAHKNVEMYFLIRANLYLDLLVFGHKTETEPIGPLHYNSQTSKTTHCDISL